MSANGYLPASELVTVQGDIQLERRTAAAFLAMREDYAEETHRNMTIAAPAGGYRPWAMQLDMRAHPALYNITPGITPGLPSDHGFGTEVDIGEGQVWAIVNGARYGFTRTKLAFHDPNHFHYDGITLAGDIGTPITAEVAHEEEEEMAIKGITWTGSDGKTRAAQYSDTGFYSDVQGDQALYNAMNAAGIPFYNTTESHAQKIAADCAKVRNHS